MGEANMIDLHCHILAGLDDGAANDTETLKMARELVAEGVGTVVATPHCNGVYGADVATIRWEVEHCQALLTEHGLPLRVLPGCEVALNGETLACWRHGLLPGLGGGQTMLLELPPLFLADGARRFVEECQALGTLVVIAHPERNPVLQRDPKLAEVLRYAGARFQITAASLDGYFGQTARVFAETLLRRRMVEYVASDLHPGRPAGLKKAAKRIKKLCGEEMAAALLRENARALLAGEAHRLAC